MKKSYLCEKFESGIYWFRISESSKCFQLRAIFELKYAEMIFYLFIYPDTQSMQFIEWTFI
jgi:hypothetical protein